MITDKDREEVQSLWKALTSQYGDVQEKAATEISRIRRESAEQARKEAADKAKEWVIGYFKDAAGLCFDTLYGAILGETVKEGNTVTRQVFGTDYRRQNARFLREVAKEIMDNAFDAWCFNKDEKQYMGAFDEDECFRILQKHFPKGTKNTEQLLQPDNL